MKSHCRSTLRLFPATTPHPWRVTSTQHSSTDSEAGALPILCRSIATVPLITHRGRWTSERTLERYIQEVTFLLHQNRHPTEIANRLSALAPRVFAEKGPATIPCSHHFATERVEEVRSNLRSGVEQQSFANSVSPLGALLLSFNDVGRKTEYTQTAHTIQARTHWDGSCRLTRTAIAPWSCFLLFFLIQNLSCLINQLFTLCFELFVILFISILFFS